MKVKYIDLIPDQAQIEIEDVGDLFWRYWQQSQVMTSHQAVREWLDVMVGYLLGRMGLRDAGNQHVTMTLATYNTRELFDELAKRFGVREFKVAPHIEFLIIVPAVGTCCIERDTGPARILVMVE